MITVKKDLSFSKMEELLQCFETDGVVKGEYQESGISRRVIASIINNALAPYIDLKLKQAFY
jgi:hypothetical protein